MEIATFNSSETTNLLYTAHKENLWDLYIRCYYSLAILYILMNSENNKILDPVVFICDPIMNCTQELCQVLALERLCPKAVPYLLALLGGLDHVISLMLLEWI